METVTAVPELLTDRAAQDRAAWLEWRRNGIGGADIPGILNLNPRWSSPYKVWADKVGLLPANDYTPRQRFALRMEAVIAEEFHDATGLYVAGEQTWCIDTDAPWRRCTVDGFAYETKPDFVPLVVEHPDYDGLGRFGGALGTVQMKTDARYTWPDDIPPAIRGQCIWEMGVTKLRHCWLAVAFGGYRFHVYEIPWDAAAADDWAFMCEKADTFWRDHVLTGVAPDIDGSEATADTLADLHPTEVPGDRMPLWPADVSELETLKAQHRHIRAEIDLFTNRIRAQMGDAEIGTVDGRAVLTLRAQTRRTECKACHHVEESEPFRVLREAPKKLRDLPPVDAD